MDAQRRIAEHEAERDTERVRSERLEQQIGALLEQVAALTQKVSKLTDHSAIWRSVAATNRRLTALRLVPRDGRSVGSGSNDRA